MMLWIGLLFFLRTIRLIMKNTLIGKWLAVSGTKKGKEFLWDIDQKSGHCSQFTAYGNQNQLQSP